MMGVMIPVYILNALYLGPLTLWTYWNYGRPTLPDDTKGIQSMSHHHDKTEDAEKPSPTMESHTEHDMSGHQHTLEEDHGMDHSKMEHGTMDHSKMNHHSKISHAQMHGGVDRPMFATVTVAVCHCGTGCLLGDLIGEWIVFGTHAKINGREIWVEFLLDYAFALVIGIFFQYWSIAPMSGEYGWKTVVRAAKADFLSLSFFEIGLFGWMAIFQFAIFGEKLPMDGVVYWWMMQIGMFLGHWTAFPINYWLIKEEIKEPCA